ncbi:MAG: SPFH domain-containing protein [Planctomycetes bacterium]|nr:SPFH domain-containing protein [Planctomycetota bacterium]
MFGIRYFKAPPTNWVALFRNGRPSREGPGLSFLYFGPSATLVSIPVATSDLPFAFTEIAADFQTVTVQGQLAWRVADPRKLAAALDFSLDARGDYRSEDPEKLRERLLATAQVLVRGEIQKLPLREALGAADRITVEVLPRLRGAEPVVALGVEVLGLSILSIRPTPEMARALEAEAREALQRQSDLAIYERRNSAVEQERRIKENELSTEIAVEEKKRTIRETQMAAEISVEEKRTALIEQRSANDRKDADAKGYALETTLKPLKGMDWRLLSAVTAGGTDPRVSIAMAFRELAENASKIGEINVTPDLLRSLLSPSGK